MSRKSLNLKRRRSTGQPMGKQHPSGQRSNPDKNTSQMMQVSRTETYSGIIPKSDEMERYESIQPGSFDRILSLAEKQTDHRIAMEVSQRNLEEKAVVATTESMKARNDHITNGQRIAFVLCAGALFVAYCFLKEGSPAAGATIATAAFAQLAAAFIFAPRVAKDSPKASE